MAIDCSVVIVPILNFLMYTYVIIVLVLLLFRLVVNKHLVRNQR